MIQKPTAASKSGGDDQKRDLKSKNTHSDAPAAHYILESFSMSSESESSSSSSEDSPIYLGQYLTSVETDSSINSRTNLSSDYTPTVSEMNWFAADDYEGIVSSSEETFSAPHETFWNEPFLTDYYCYTPINVSPYDSYCSNDTDFFPNLW